MPLYFFRVKSGRFSGAEDRGTDFADNDAAWDELRRVVGDLLGSVSRKLKPNSKWQMELLDDSRKPIFEITLFAEALDK
jgi:hypothetical protein